MRLMMIENPKAVLSDPTSSAIDPLDATVSDRETTALLPNANFTYQTSNRGLITENDLEATPKRGFYQVMLSDARVIIGLSNTVLSSSLLAAFDTTLTLHLRDAFGWGSLAAGMIFVCLQLPIILLGPLAGWLRDRAGLRYPTTTGWALLAPIMWLMGIAGTDISSSGSIINGERMFIFAVVAFGVITPLVRGAGYLQLSRKPPPFSIYSAY